MNKTRTVLALQGLSLFVSASFRACPVTTPQVSGFVIGVVIRVYPRLERIPQFLPVNIFLFGFLFNARDNAVETLAVKRFRRHLTFEREYCFGRGDRMPRVAEEHGNKNDCAKEHERRKKGDKE